MAVWLKAMHVGLDLDSMGFFHWAIVYDARPEFMAYSQPVDLKQAH